MQQCKSGKSICPVRHLIWAIIAIQSGIASADDGWQISWSSSISGGGSEQDSGVSRSSSVNGSFEGSYTTSGSSILTGSSSGVVTEAFHSERMVVCGQGDTLGQGLDWGSSSSLVHITGPSQNEGTIALTEYAHPSGRNKLLFNVYSHANCAVTQSSSWERPDIADCSPLSGGGGDSWNEPCGNRVYWAHGGELQAVDKQNRTFTGSFSSTGYSPYHFGQVTVTFTATATKSPYPKVRGMEISQVIQDRNNSVTLVKNKATWVRALIEGQDIDHVRAKLHGRAKLSGNPLPGSPIWPENKSGGVALGYDNANFRGRRDSTLNFRLPDSWTTSDDDFFHQIELELEPLPLLGNKMVECASNCLVSPKFHAVPEVDIRFIRVKHSAASVTTKPTLRDVQVTKRRLKSALPISGISKLPLFGLDWNGPLNDDLIDHLNAIHDLNCMHDTAECNRIYHAMIDIPFDASEQGVANGWFVSWAGINASATGSGRNNAAHEIGHNLDLEHTVHDAFVPESSDEKRGPCRSTGEKSVPNFPFIYDFDGHPSDYVTPASADMRAFLGPMQLDSGLNPSALSPDELIYGLNFYPLSKEPGLRFSRYPAILDPHEHFALMSYCDYYLDAGGNYRGWNYAWASRENYHSLISAISSRFDDTLASATSVTAANNEPVSEYLYIHGSANSLQRTVELAPLIRITPTVTPPEPEPGELIVAGLTRTGEVLDWISFNTTSPVRVIEPGFTQFAFAVPGHPDLQRLVVVHEDAPSTVLAELTASTNAPSVEVLFPDGGEILAGAEAVIEWTAEDLDGDPLIYTISYSADSGASWQVLDTGITGPTYTVDLSQFAGTNQALIAVQASDGFLSTSDQSDATFEVASQEPSIYILEPAEEESFLGEQLVLLSVDAVDAEDGVLADDAIQWLSNVDGGLGHGSQAQLRASMLTSGEHLLTVTGTDSDGKSASATVSIHVKENAPEADLTLELAPTTREQLVPNGQRLYLITVTNNGSELASEILLHGNLDDGIKPVSATPDQGNCNIEGQRLVCTINTLASGAFATISIVLEAVEVGSYDLSYLVTATELDTNLDDNQVRESVRVLPSAVSGDLDGDSVVDNADYQFILAALGECEGDGEYSAAADINADGCVAQDDYQAWYAIYKASQTNSQPAQPAGC